MTASENTFDDSPTELAQRIADLVLTHPSVSRLHSGEFGEITSHLPRRKVSGVRVGGTGRAIEIGVVLRLDRPLPVAIDELRVLVQPLVGSKAVDITVGDVVSESAPSYEPEQPEDQPESP